MHIAVICIIVSHTCENILSIQFIFSKHMSSSRLRIFPHYLILWHQPTSKKLGKEWKQKQRELFILTVRAIGFLVVGTICECFYTLFASNKRHQIPSNLYAQLQTALYITDNVKTLHIIILFGWCILSFVDAGWYDKMCFLFYMVDFGGDDDNRHNIQISWIYQCFLFCMVNVIIIKYNATNIRSKSQTIWKTPTFIILLI